MLDLIEVLHKSNLGIVHGATPKQHAELRFMLDSIQGEVDEGYRRKKRVQIPRCLSCDKQLEPSSKSYYCPDCNIRRIKTRTCDKCGQTKKLIVFDGDSPTCWACEILGAR